jgi:hypothetical protein
MLAEQGAKVAIFDLNEEIGQAACSASKAVLSA